MVIFITLLIKVIKAEYKLLSLGFDWSVNWLNLQKNNCNFERSWYHEKSLSENSLKTPVIHPGVEKRKKALAWEFIFPELRLISR